jgi:quinol monooxygenase YgiN
MATKALLVRLEAKPGKESAVEEFLVSALPLVEQEPDTKPWFAVRFGPSTFGIIDAFPDDAAREAHLGGPVGKALAEKADELFASPPDISSLDVLATSSDAAVAMAAVVVARLWGRFPLLTGRRCW